MSIYYHVGGIRCDDAEQERNRTLDQKDKTKQLTLRMPENLHRAFKLAAVKQGRSMGAVTIELIEKFVKKTSEPL